MNRAITLIAEAKPGRISSSLIKDLGEHPEDKKPVRIMKGQYGPYIKYKSLKFSETHIYASNGKDILINRVSGKIIISNKGLPNTTGNCKLLDRRKF